MGVSIRVIGSLIEGTRVGQVDEADCFIFFDKLKPEHFDLSDSPTQYVVTESGVQELGTCFVDQCRHLNYFKFLEILLDSINEFIHQATLPEGMTVSSWLTMCHDCRTGEEGEIGHLKHCDNCLPAVTFTKAGPCCILDDNGTVVSIDLIPLLPCPEKDTVTLFEKVMGALVDGNLPNWLSYLKKFVRSDTLLPEALSSPKKPKDGYISMKLLHARSDQDCFILRPGQTLAMKNLRNPKLKMTYCFLKALKSLMEVDLSSYSIKKVLLLEEFGERTKEAKDAFELLFIALSHPHLMPSFQKVFEISPGDDDDMVKRKIDFDKWRVWIADNVAREEAFRQDWEYKCIPLTDVPN